MEPGLNGTGSGAEALTADLDADGEVTTRERLVFLRRLWRAAPRRVRQAIVAVVGLTLVLLGLALAVLPGPFTLPLVIAGFAVLGTEFAWAAHALQRGRHHASRAGAAVRRTLRR